MCLLRNAIRGCGEGTTSFLRFEYGLQSDSIAKRKCYLTYSCNLSSNHSFGRLWRCCTYTILKLGHGVMVEAGADPICCATPDTPASDALTACIEVALEVREAVEGGRQRSVLKTTAPQMLSNFDSTTIWQPASLTAAPAVGHTIAPEDAA